MKQEDIWDNHCRELTDFMTTHQRRPSKYRPDEHSMLNWFKYARKQLAKGKLSVQQQQQLAELTALAQKLQRKNQYAYLTSCEKEDTKELLLPFNTE